MQHVYSHPLDSVASPLGGEKALCTVVTPISAAQDTPRPSTSTSFLACQGHSLEGIQHMHASARHAFADVAGTA